jgi:integrase
VRVLSPVDWSQDLGLFRLIIAPTFAQHHEGFDRLVDVSPTHLKPILRTAYYTGMRRGELLKLTWDRIAPKAEVIRLRLEETKT